ncbi:hypothetical protein H257_00125 [Aphanomyces astaci]|uniref:Uncharacterized protein n=1 Tax=Aphanomyces astaci TaxID=112090 RepID=W4HBU1_APHAT|nr:hypothetical protein H257_00125 [Aphanomyces astaci]ETV88563.1 hypothetical protein H257_00125 [Aphanomyces astaci]|eukprot:XP_009820963.1 hypothetical protein H257_00125 [Aphanomyces astaci]
MVSNGDEHIRPSTNMQSQQQEGDDDFEALLMAPTVPAPDTSTDHDVIDQVQEDSKTHLLKAYVDDFDGVVPAAEVVVASIPLEVVQQREIQLERARIQRAQEEANEYQMRETLLAYKEQKARDRLAEEAIAHTKKMAAKELQSLQVVNLQSKSLWHVYHQAETHLKNVLTQQQAHVQHTYGTMSSPSSSSHTHRRYRTEWASIPQPIEIHVHMLRAVKDKLPQGHYVLLATLYDRLGGSPISWSVAGDRGIGTALPGLTTPLSHRGHFYNTELPVDQNVYVVCPPQHELRPANVVVFEMYLLSGANATKDAVVGWGVLPVCNADFDVLAGRFKVPLIRGDVDHTITKFHEIEHMYLTDLSSWLCNMYVTVRHLPRERLDATGMLQREYDVEVDVMNQLLKLESTDRDLLAQGTYDDDIHVQARREQSSSSRRRRRPQNLLTPTPVSFSNTVSWGKDAAKVKTRRRTKPRHASTKVTPIDADAAANDADDNRHDMFHHDDEDNSKPYKSRSWRQWFRRRWRRRQGSKASRSNLLSQTPQEATTTTRDLFLDKHDDDDDKDMLDDPFPPVDAPEPAHAQTWEGFTFATNQYIGDEVAKHTRFQTARKLRYLKQELFADMGFNKATTMQFWLMVVFLCLALWLRVYVHYLGQWLYLRAVNVPVFAFNPQMLTVVLKYTWNTVPTPTEIGVIAVGVVFNIATFIGLMGIASACQKLLGEFPDIGSRFIACFGLATVFDPMLVLAIDLVQHNYDCASIGECKDPSSSSCRCAEGDAFKLYQRFKSEEGTGVVGAVLTLLVYGFLMSVAAVVFYTYLLHFHMNGRMLDVYRRIHAREGVFFVPNDFEVSDADVAALCDRAARWKSMTGTQRKTAVCEYELRDPLDPAFVETTVHIAIFNLELDGSRQLYRHFIKNPDGEILEVFGTISDSLGSQYAALESALFQTAPPEHDTHTGLFDAL